MNLSLNGSLPLLAFRAYAMKDDVITGEVETMGIPDPILKPGNKIHIYIEDAPARFAFHMAVATGDMVEMIGAAWNFQTAYFTHFR